MKIKIRESGEIYDIPDLYSLQNGEEYAYNPLSEAERGSAFDGEAGMYVLRKDYFELWRSYLNLEGFKIFP